MENKFTFNFSIFILFLEIFLFPGAMNANIINAVSCSESDVQNAINTAVTGDVVQIPAGNCSWTNGISITGKNIILQGVGKTSTVITLNVPSEGIFMGPNASRVTGLGFILASGWFFIRTQGQNFRVDNCRFENQVGNIRDAVYAYGDYPGGIYHPTGVIDHNELVDARTLVVGDINVMANTIWAEPSTIGNQNQTGVVYIEDNTFTFSIFSNSIDADYGGRYVFRYNTITCGASAGGYFEAHSVMQGGNNRATKSWEIYNNTLSRTDGFFTAMFLRGGTGVVFNNTITGAWGNIAQFDNVRSFDNTTNPPAGPCDGSSFWDGNITNGWPCRDQIGRGQDNTGTFPKPQTSEPAYFWNNTLNGNSADPDIANCSNAVKPNGSCSDIVSGRDYFTSAKPGYVPYCYPHPLVSGIPCTTTGTLENNLSEEINIYPNPFSETATMRITNGTTANYELKLYDIYGKEIQADVIRNSDSFVIRRDNLSAGIYILEIQSENKTKRIKLVVN